MFVPHNFTVLHSFLYPMPTLVIADFLTSWSVTRRCKGGRLFRNIEVLHTDKSGLYDPETRSNWWMKDSDKAVEWMIMTPGKWQCGVADWRCGRTTCNLRSCTLNQCKDLIIWSGFEDLGAATTARAKHSGCAEGDLAGFEKDHWVAVVKPRVYKWCADGVSCVKIENKANATKITNVVEACTRDSKTGRNSEYDKFSLTTTDCHTKWLLLLGAEHKYPYLLTYLLTYLT